MPVSPGAGPVIRCRAGCEWADAIRIGVMLPRAAAYGFDRAMTRVRMASKIAESTQPEMCKVALHTATWPSLAQAP